MSASRREFVQGISAVFGLIACGCTEDVSRLLRRHFKKLSPEEIQSLIATHAAAAKSAAGGRDVRVTATPAKGGVSWGYGLDLGHCVGCRKCVYACARENNTSRSPQVQWIRVFEMKKGGGIDFEHGDEFYEPDTVPQNDKFYVPTACMHCADPPCVKVCPVDATWAEPDGIVVIDYDWCIGCRYCQAACPYGARHFNWSEPQLPPDEVSTDLHVLGNVPRQAGVVEKCTFCIHRVREGKYPACLEACPVGARIFGNLLDPHSEIRHLLDTKNVFVLKAELDTKPRFFYFWG